MTQIVIVLLLLFAVVWFGAFVYVALPILGGGALAFFVVYLVGRFRFVSLLRRPEKAGALVATTGSDDTIYLDPLWKPVRRRTATYQALAVMACFGSGLTLGLLVDRSYLWVNADMERPLLIVALSALSVVLWIKPKLSKFVAKHLRKALRDVNHVLFSKASEFRALTSRNAELAGRMGISFPQASAKDWEAFLSSRIVELLADPSLLQKSLDEQVEKARRDCRQLQLAAGRLEEIGDVYKVTAPYVVAARSPSLLAALDQVFVEFEQAKSRFLPARKWQDFANAANTCLRAVRDCKRTAQNLGGSDGGWEESHAWEGSQASPYEILRISPQAPLKDIRAVYRKLSSIYHPDMGLTPDGEEMRKINAAYEEIMAQRGTPV